MNQIESLDFFTERAEVKTIAEINYNDLDKLITETFRQIVNPNLPYYEIVAYQELNNYQKTSFDLDGTNYSAKEWPHYEEKLKNGKWPHFATQALLFRLVELKYIPPCELVVDVYW